MTDKPEVIIDSENGEGKKTVEPENNKSIAVAHEILPEVLIIVPIFDRPIFPKMMGPVAIDNQELKKSIVEGLEASNGFLGLVMVNSDDESGKQYPVSAEEFYKVGVIVKVVKASTLSEDQPLQLMLQSVDRFDITKMTSKGEVFRARVKHWYETEFDTNEELKAYSVAIIDSIKELVNLNPLFKEGLSLVLEKINPNDPRALADFSSSIDIATISNPAEWYFL